MSSHGTPKPTSRIGSALAAFTVAAILSTWLDLGESVATRIAVIVALSILLFAAAEGLRVLTESRSK